MRDDVKAAGTGMAFGTVLFFWILGLSIAGTGIYLFVMPTFMNQQTHIVRNTNMYVTSRVTALRTLKTAYDENETKLAEDRAAHVDQSVIDARESQQAGLIQQMREQADLVEDKDLIPADIRRFLADHAEHS